MVAKNVYLEFINQALHSLRICTPYLILDNDLLTCLRLAAKRGVDVRIYTPGVPDKKRPSTSCPAVTSRICSRRA